MASSYLQDGTLMDYYSADPNFGYNVDFNKQYAPYSYQGYTEESFANWESSLESPSSLSISDQENDPFQNLDCVMQEEISGDCSEAFQRSYKNCDQDGNIESVNDPDGSIKGKYSRRAAKSGPVRKIHQRHAANVRERKRMKTINDAFEHLRVRVPTACDDRKMSKVDTLKMAIKYIGDLTELLKSCGDGALPGMRTKTNNRILIKYNLLNEDKQDGFTPVGPENRLYGHSLSWVDTRECAPVINNRLRAKLWIPQHATAEDMATMTTTETS